MAKASFYVNDIKVRKKGDHLILEARKQCQHGTVFDEIFLTLPSELGFNFTMVDTRQDFPSLKNNENKSLTEHFKRFTTDN